MVSFVLSSVTINRSSGDLPVYFPVSTESEPVEFTTPSLRDTASATISSELRFRWTLDGLIPNVDNCDENLSVTIDPTTSVIRLHLQKYQRKNQACS